MIHRMFLVMNLPRGDSWNRKLRIIIKCYVSDDVLENNNKELLVVKKKHSAIQYNVTSFNAILYNTSNRCTEQQQ